MVTSGWREGFVGRSARQNIIEKGPSDSYDDGVQLLLGIVPGNTSRLVVESSEAVIISPTSACFIIATTQSVPFFFRSISQVGPLASYSLLLIFAPSVRPTLSLFLILFFFPFVRPNDPSSGPLHVLTTVVSPTFSFFCLIPFWLMTQLTPSTNETKKWP